MAKGSVWLLHMNSLLCDQNHTIEIIIESTGPNLMLEQMTSVYKSSMVSTNYNCTTVCNLLLCYSLFVYNVCACDQNVCIFLYLSPVLTEPLTSFVPSLSSHYRISSQIFLGNHKFYLIIC